MILKVKILGYLMDGNFYYEIFIYLAIVADKLTFSFFIESVFYLAIFYFFITINYPLAITKVIFMSLFYSKAFYFY